MPERGTGLLVQVLDHEWWGGLHSSTAPQSRVNVGRVRDAQGNR